MTDYIPENPEEWTIDEAIDWATQLLPSDDLSVPLPESAPDHVSRAMQILALLCYAIRDEYTQAHIYAMAFSAFAALFNGEVALDLDENAEE